MNLQSTRNLEKSSKVHILCCVSESNAVKSLVQSRWSSQANVLLCSMCRALQSIAEHCRALQSCIQSVVNSAVCRRFSPVQSWQERRWGDGANWRVVGWPYSLVASRYSRCVYFGSRPRYTAVNTCQHMSTHVNTCYQVVRCSPWCNNIGSTHRRLVLSWCKLLVPTKILVRQSLENSECI